MVAPLFGGGRGLKQEATEGVMTILEVAPLFGGGRGLKPFLHRHTVADGEVAPLFGGGRGLKPSQDHQRRISDRSLLSSEGGVD